jgi:polyisoprenoid-binding protein YceI
MATSTTAPARVSTWDIDPSHSAAHFSVRHMMVSTVRGEFGKLTGSVTLDPADVTRWSVQASIDATSINTREPQRDAHLRSPDFFDVERFPTIDFRSTKIVRTGPDTYELTGQLTLHGVTREITLSVESDGVETKDPYGKLRRGASATGKLNRKDFGLNWNQTLEAGGILVGEEVKISIDVELILSA